MTFCCQLLLSLAFEFSCLGVLIYWLSCLVVSTFKTNKKYLKKIKTDYVIKHVDKHFILKTYNNMEILLHEHFRHIYTFWLLQYIHDITIWKKQGNKRRLLFFFTIVLQFKTEKRTKIIHHFKKKPSAYITHNATHVAWHHLRSFVRFSVAPSGAIKGSIHPFVNIMHHVLMLMCEIGGVPL